MEDNTQLDSVFQNTEEECQGKKLLRSWLNKSMKIQMTDGRTLIGIFLCTDSERNVILGSCEEYLKPPEILKLVFTQDWYTTDQVEKKEEPRILGLAMIPGHHIVSIHVDEDRGTPQQSVM